LIVNRRYWIPPVALGAGQLAHGASWIFAARFGAAPSVCAWLTCTGLVASRCFGLVDDDGAGDSRTRHSRLYRCDWKGERIARGALFAFEAAVIALVVAFWTGAITVLPWAGTLIVLALACYLVPATSTLATAFAGPKTEAALARALLITLGSLLITAVIGAVLALDVGWIGPTRPRSYRRDRRFMVRSALSAG
jgi:hypothetical protein